MKPMHPDQVRRIVEQRNARLAKRPTKPYEPRHAEAQAAKEAGCTEDQQRMLDDAIDSAGP